MGKNHLFRKALLPAVVTLLCAGSTPLFAQQTLKSYLNDNVISLKVGGNSTVNIRAGDTNMVYLTTKEKAKHVFTFHKGTIEVRDGNHSINLILKNPDNFSVEATDNTTVNVADFDCPRFGVKAYDNALVNMQTLHSKHVEIQAFANARVNAGIFALGNHNHDKSTYLKMMAHDNASIHMDSLLVGEACLHAYSNSTITIESGRVTRYLEDFSDYDGNARIERHVFAAKSLSKGSNYADATLKELQDLTNILPKENRFGSHIFWGFHTWINEETGFANANEANSVRTTFNTFQFQFEWKLVQRRNSELSIGMGMEFDRYKFNENYVHLADNSTPRHFETWDADMLAANGLAFPDHEAWCSRLITRYVTMPLTYTAIFPGQKVKLSVGVVPGFRLDGKKTGLRHFYDDGTIEYEERVDVTNNIHPFKCDVRAMVKWHGIGIFVQVPTMPINYGMDAELYPIKFGIVI